MTTVTVTEAWSKLHRLMDAAAETHESVLVTCQDRAVQETLFLLSVPGMRESICEGMATSVDDCDQGLDW